MSTVENVHLSTYLNNMRHFHLNRLCDSVGVLEFYHRVVASSSLLLKPLIFVLEYPVRTIWTRCKTYRATGATLSATEQGILDLQIVQ